MQVVLTTAGQALVESSQGPVAVTSFQLGSAFGYIPQASDTAIHGSLVYTGVPAAPVVVNANVVCYTSYLDATIGPFAFGEIGLFVGSTLFALAAGDSLIQKTAVTGDPGNLIRIDEYLSVVNTSYSMWVALTTSEATSVVPVLASVDQLPPPNGATPNQYIISGASSAQSSFQAYTDQNSLWNFDAYAFANQAVIPITSFTSQSVTIALGNYQPGFNPEYFGQIVVEFSSGVNYGICRYVQSVVISGSSATLNFRSILLQSPVVGDSITIFGRQSLSTTIVNLPVATTSALGGIIVGTTLEISDSGVLNVGPSGQPVISVNGLTGAVVLNNTNITGFAAVAYNGEYSSLIGAPAAYTLPAATTTTLGGVIVSPDGNLSIAGNGTIDLGFSPVKTVNSVAPDGSGNVVVTPNVIGLIAPTAIAASTDFNTLQTTGLYFGLDANASTFLNAPTTATGGTLDVEPFTTTATGGDLIQRYTTNAGLYFRRYAQSSNTWSTWISVSTSTAIPPATTSTIGGVIVGSGLVVTGGGTLSAAVTSVNGSTGAVVLTASSISGFAAVATSGSYADLSSTPTFSTGLTNTSGTITVTGVAANSLTNPGWRTNPDGTIEMWGNATVASGVNSVVVTLPTAIPTAYLNGLASDIGNNAYSFGIAPLSLTTITIYAPTYWGNTGALVLRGSAECQWHIWCN